MKNTNQNTATPPRTATPPFRDDLPGEETDMSGLLDEETNHLSLTEPMVPDMEMLQGKDLSKRQNAVVDEAGVHVIAQQAHLLKDKIALDNSMRLNEYSSEQVVSLLIRSDFIESRALGRPCQEMVAKFMKQRRNRMVFTADKVEERSVMKQLNEAGRSVHPKPKQEESKLSLIFRLFSSNSTTITQEKGQDEGLPMITGNIFGNE